MLGLPDGVSACLFDMDGVVTQTATVHAAAWKEMFDEFLSERAKSTGTEFVPFDPHHQDGRGHRQGAGPAGQAGAGHVPGRRRGARRARRARGGLRGRPGRGGGGPRGPLRPGGRRGPGRPGRRAQGPRRRHRGQGPVGASRGKQMIKQAAYGTEPWRLVEKELDLDLLAQSESIFALSNGHIGLRGNLDEGDPHGLPGTYLNSMYEVRPLPYATAAYESPDSGQTASNVP